MNNLQVIEHKNERVLTTQQLAEIYETSTDNIKNNFNRNKDRFIEDRDYYLLKGNDLKKFKNFVNNSNYVTDSYLVDPRTRSLYLWTERGANRHSKILDTDKAWQQFDLLEETYFKVKKMKPMEILKLQNEALFELDERVEHLENNMTINTSQQYHLEKMVKNKVVKMLGGKNSSAYLKCSKKVFSQLWRDYKDYFKIPSYRDTLKAKYNEAENYILNWQLEYNLMIEICSYRD